MVQMLKQDLKVSYYSYRLALIRIEYVVTFFSMLNNELDSFVLNQRVNHDSIELIVRVLYLDRLLNVAKHRIFVEYQAEEYLIDEENVLNHWQHRVQYNSLVLDWY